ncbi:hypothetical protein KUTeg_008112 [Tegillarca granosa]|uniref:Uncharacterized protein n=1 Tax=Tegillarca granosa TaxID=220873 RepID=A0ABQ9F871_TEGGR|nr:hypothetical protein KUTeg_008112 [Tegillarca granosa]
MMKRTKVSQMSKENHFAAEQLQVKLLTTEEKYRSQILYKQIHSFEEKVYMCHENFNVDLMLTMFRELARRSKGSRDIYTIIGIRQSVEIERRKIQMQKRNKRLKSDTDSVDDMLNYFTWFLDYIKYMRELRANFVDRIFNPLFKYFLQVSGPSQELDSPIPSARSDSVVSAHLSVASFQTGISGVSKLSGWSSFNFSDSAIDENRSGDDVHEARREMLSRAALLLLGREFDDIKSLYDTSEIEKLAFRLSSLKEQLDYLIDNENIINPDLFSQDSEKPVHHLKVRNSRTYALMRLIPDILVKFEKAAWIARRWLELDDMKTKDINEKLDKLASLEARLSTRLSMLSKNIQNHERELEKESNELQKLLKREERSNNLQMSLQTYEENLKSLESELEKLNKEKKELISKLEEAQKSMKRSEMRKLKTQYQKNRLQRYAIERQIGNVKFHIDLFERDLCVEMDVKKSMVHFTNDVQDHCEELEKLLERQKKEKRTIQAALIPIAKDKKMLSEQISEESVGEWDDEVFARYVGTSKIQKKKKAVYVRTFTENDKLSRLQNVRGTPDGMMYPPPSKHSSIPRPITDHQKKAVR